MRNFTRQNDDAHRELFGLTRPLPLDPAIRYEMLRMLDQLQGRIEMMDLVSGQLIDNLTKMRFVPAAPDVRSKVQGFPTYQFCREHSLPLRSMEAAMVPVPA